MNMQVSIKRSPAAKIKELETLLAELEAEFAPWRDLYIDVAQHSFPRRARLLTSSVNGGRIKFGSAKVRTKLFDTTSTKALRVLASGLFNGITPPTRDWFNTKFRSVKANQTANNLAERYLYNRKARLTEVFAGSNFYSSMALGFLCLATFGSYLILIYEDFDDVVHFQNVPIGEFRFITDAKGAIIGITRTYSSTVDKTVRRFGLENCSDRTKREWEKGGSSRLSPVTISHVIEPNSSDEDKIPVHFKFREFYWETGDGMKDKYLSVAGFREKPFMAGRWEIEEGQSYGTSPMIETLADVKRLQTQQLRAGTALDILLTPPLLASSSLRMSGVSMLPRSVTYVSNLAVEGTKPIHTINPPFAEMQAGVLDVRKQIEDNLFSDLFRGISQLDTVRSAAEIYERRGERLVQLGSVLDRFNHEGLSAGFNRVQAIADRAGLLEPLPDGLDKTDFSVEYVSILADAQRASGTVVIERFLQIVSQTGAIEPKVLRIPDFEKIIRDYAHRLSLPATHIRPEEEIQQEDAAMAEEQAQAQQLQVGSELTQAAKGLSETDVGGGQNALSQLLA